MNNLIYVGYCRVSTDNQKEEGTIEIQESALYEYCHQNKITLIEIFKDDGVTGGLEDRPGLSLMLDYLETHHEISGILIFKLDRLARDLYIQEHLIKKFESLNQKLISIKEPNLDSDDPMRKAFRQFMGIVSELEKSFITMRLSSGRINKAKKVKYSGGGIPLGYSLNESDIQIDDTTIKTIKMIFKLKRVNKMGVSPISTYLNKNNVPTLKGGKWYPSTVKYILENTLYKGKIHYNGVTVKREDLNIG